MAATPDDLYARLRELQIEWTAHEHPPLRTVEESRRLRGALPGAHCKNLFLKDGKGQYWLVVALEDRAIDLKALPAAIGSARLSFGRAERLREVLGVEPGAVTPFALINDPEHRVRVVLDAAMLERDPLNFHPLVNTATITLDAESLQRFVAAMGHDVQRLEETP
ncbi:MAG: prolyl-tRNA synthetase associated domain-containing protein [Myxococcota bacterium]